MNKNNNDNQINYGRINSVNRDTKNNHFRIICYLDLLGFSKKIQGFTITNKANVYRTLIRNYKDSSSINIYNPSFTIIKQKAKVTWFSDTVVLYSKTFPRDKPSENKIINLLSSVRDLFIVLLKDGFPSRGSISIGQFYVEESEGIYVGNTLVKAHNFAEDMQIAGVSIIPEALEYLNTHNIADIRYNFQGSELFVDYPVLLKSDKIINTKFINWVTDGYKLLVKKETIKKSFKKNSKGNRKEYKKKLENTEAFYSKIVTDMKRYGES